MPTLRLPAPSLIEPASQCRREFLTGTASGLGLAALGAALAGDGVLGIGQQPAPPRPLAATTRSCHGRPTSLRGPRLAS